MEQPKVSQAERRNPTILSRIGQFCAKLVGRQRVTEYRTSAIDVAFIRHKRPANDQSPTADDWYRSQLRSNAEAPMQRVPDFVMGLRPAGEAKVSVLNTVPEPRLVYATHTRPHVVTSEDFLDQAA